MKKIVFLLCFLLSLCAFGQIEKIIPARPNPPRLVNDFANALTIEQRQALENKLVAYDDSTSNQVAVVIIPSTQDYPIEDVSLGILRKWGVGGTKNNGIVVLVALNDKKARIEAGYGLEGAIPDITAGSIIQNDIAPAFKEGNYYRGLDNATTSIIKAAAGEYKAPEGYANRGGGSSGGLSSGKIIIAIFIIFLILRLFGGGGGGGGFLSRRGFWGGPVIFPGGFGGGWGSGGGGWSGGGGGGGFGGFGGGSGGGGGASGSW